MSLETSRKILKIFGVLGIIGAIFVLIAGLLVILGGGLAATDAGAEAGLTAKDSAALMIIGFITILTGALSLIEGIVSVKASKDNKYGNLAWIFALLSILSSAVNAIYQIATNGFKLGDIITYIITIAIGALILVAANNVKQAFKSEGN